MELLPSLIPGSSTPVSTEWNVVQQNYVKLLEHLDAKSSVNLFFGSSFITADTLERVDKAITTQDANKVLVDDLLQGISPSRFSRFVSLLRESADKYKRPHHIALADELEEDLKVSCCIVFVPIVLVPKVPQHQVVWVVVPVSMQAWLENAGKIA